MRRKRDTLGVEFHSWLENFHFLGSMTPTRSSSEDFMRHHHHPPPPPPPGHPPTVKPQVAPRTFKTNLQPSSSSGSSESLSSTSSPDLNSETANILNEAAATSAASQAIMAEAAAKFGLEHKGTTSSSSSSTTSSRHRGIFLMSFISSLIIFRLVTIWRSWIFSVESQCLFWFYFKQRIFTRKICQILKVVFSR